jgi:predicted CXXCH cytochrome family protein
MIAACLVCFGWPAGAVETTKKEGPPVARFRTNNLAPLPAGEKALLSHSPYETGDCSLCHKNKDPKDPGPLTGSVNEICLGCHEDFQKLISGKSTHAAAKESCVNCHNPHNSKRPKLLVEDSSALCLSCHQSVNQLLSNAKVQHDALTLNAKCANCHNPHGAKEEHLLTAPLYDLCLNCHGKDGVRDHDGRLLTNMKRLLADNPEVHSPVASKDCGACHVSHGGGNPHLLTLEYPAGFYSPYDPKLYALCFDCHEESAMKEARTTAATKFRDGDNNLHYVHVNKAERGRACGACHEVHASRQKHQIRDGVPYGPKGWILQLNFTQTPTGGYCAKTCHETRGYTNAPPATTPDPAGAGPAKNP